MRPFCAGGHMDVVQSVNGVSIRPTDERWDHILEGHPEFINRKAAVLLSVGQPTVIVAGTAGELIAMRRLEGPGWIVVPYRELSNTDGFIITAFTSKAGPSPQRIVVWPSA